MGGLTVNELRNDAANLVWAQQDVTTGERIYRENCAANATGQKATARVPRSRDLRLNRGTLPPGDRINSAQPRPGRCRTDEDIFRTISRGVRGTGMLAQLQLSEKERWTVTRISQELFEPYLLTKKVASRFVIPPKPASSPKLVALGRSIYTEAGCAQCHGVGGRGNGSSAKDLKDDWSNPILPTDLTLKPFKSGPDPVDLFRTISTGLNGTPMPSYAEALIPNDRWALVSYVFSIATKEKPRGMMGLVGEGGFGKGDANRYEGGDGWHDGWQTDDGPRRRNDEPKHAGYDREDNPWL